MELADDLPQELLELLDWLEDNYVGRMNKKGAMADVLSFFCYTFGMFTNDA